MASQVFKSAQFQRQRLQARVGVTDNELAHSRFLALVTHVSEGDVEVRLVCILRKKWEALEPADHTLHAWNAAPAEAKEGTLWSVRLGTDRFPPLEQAAHDTNGDATDAFSLAEAYRVKVTEDPPVGVVEIITQSLPDVPAQASRGRSKLQFKSLGQASATGSVQALSEAFDDLETVRLRFIVEGVRQPPLGAVLVTIQEKCAVGPLFLEQGQDGLWRAPAGLVAVRQPPDKGSVVSLEINGIRRRALSPDAGMPAETAAADFRSDDAVVEAAKDTLAESCGDGPTQGALEETLKVLERKQATLRTDQADYYLARRTQATLERLLGRIERRAELRDGILRTPEAQAMIEEAKSGALRAAEKDVAEQRKALESVRAERESEERRLGDLQERIRLAETEAAERTDARVAEIAGGIVERVASGIAALAVEVPEATRRGAPPPNSADYEEAWPADARGDATDIETAAEALERLKRRLKADGFDEAHAVPLLASWLSDRIPVVAGADALRLLEAAADSLAGGRRVWIPATADMTMPADLFGRVHALTGAYCPHPSRLADAVLACSQKGDTLLGLAIFGGANLADIPSVFLPVADVYADAWRGGRRLPVLHPASVAENDPYRPLADAAWPKPLLAAFTFIAGATPLPPPPAFWSRATFIVADEVVAMASVGARRSGATLKQWADMRKSVGKAQPTTGLRRPEHRFTSALTTLGVDATEAGRLWRIHCELPGQVALGRTPEATEDPVLDELATRIRSALFGGDQL